MRGDANGDGTFNGLADGLTLLSWQFVAGTPPLSCPSAADADDSGTVNGLVDGAACLNFQFVAGSPPPPPPFPGCGSDPTPDSLGCSSSGCP